MKDEIEVRVMLRGRDITNQPWTPPPSVDRIIIQLALDALREGGPSICTAST